MKDVPFWGKKDGKGPKINHSTWGKRDKEKFTTFALWSTQLSCYRFWVSLVRQYAHVRHGLIFSYSFLGVFFAAARRLWRSWLLDSLCMIIVVLFQGCVVNEEWTCGADSVIDFSKKLRPNSVIDLSKKLRPFLNPRRHWRRPTNPSVILVIWRINGCFSCYFIQFFWG